MDNDIMKVLAINASPLGKRGSTHKLLTALINGMQDAGAQTELANLNSLKMILCTSCIDCLTTTPGRCPLKDDINPLMEKLAESDIVIYGTPIHNAHITPLLKGFIDRCLPIYIPDMLEGNDLKNNPPIKNKPKKIILVASSAIPEWDQFELVISYFKYITERRGDQYLGEILLNMGELLKMESVQKSLSQYYQAISDAGKEIILTGRISDTAQGEINRSWITNDIAEYKKAAKKYYSDIQTKYL